jgi:hypothetical protein
VARIAYFWCDINQRIADVEIEGLPGVVKEADAVVKARSKLKRSINY